MILQRLNAAPAKRIPAAMALLCLGLMLVVLNTLWPRMGWIHAHLSPRWSDFLRGFVIGIGIALEGCGLLAAMTACKRRGNS